MLSSLVSDLTGELGRHSPPEPMARPRPAELELPHARQAELVICDYAIERSFAGLGRNRRLSKDYERLCETTEAWIYLAMARLMLRRLVAR